MKNINKQQIFNPETLNIFTDASITKVIHSNGYEETIACAGHCLVSVDTNNNFYESSGIKLIRYATNNIGEINAIYDGILSAIPIMNNYEVINLFSDSKICIMGLREWIFNWFDKSKDGKILLGSSGIVSNQEVFKRIVHLVCNNNLKINLYHQKGHVDINSEKSLNNAINVFNMSNNLYLEKDLMYTLSYYNDNVDKFTKVALEEIEDKIVLSETCLYDPFIRVLNDQIMLNYKNNIKREMINNGQTY